MPAEHGRPGPVARQPERMRRFGRTWDGERDLRNRRGVIDIAVCAPLGVLGSASICPPARTPTTTPGGPSMTPGGPQGIRNPSSSGSDMRILGRMPQRRNH